MKLIETHTHTPFPLSLEDNEAGIKGPILSDGCHPGTMTTTTLNEQDKNRKARTLTVSVKNEPYMIFTVIYRGTLLKYVLFISQHAMSCHYLHPFTNNQLIPVEQNCLTDVFTHVLLFL